MTAGVIFGVVPGTAVVSVAGTLACTISFLIARYVARDKVRRHFVGISIKRMNFSSNDEWEYPACTLWCLLLACWPAQLRPPFRSIWRVRPNPNSNPKPPNHPTPIQISHPHNAMKQSRDVEEAHPRRDPLTTGSLLIV